MTMSRHRILRLITWLPAGGIERKILAVLPRLNSDLFELHVCCLRERGPLAEQLETAGIPVHVVRFGRRWDPLALMRLRNLARGLNISLIHAHMYRANTPATVMKMFDKRIVVAAQYHNMDTWDTPWQLRMDRLLAPRRDLNVAVSEAVRCELIERLALPAEKTRTIYNGVDIREFHPVAAAERHALRERMGLPVAARLVIMPARLTRQKNQALVIGCARDILQAAPRTHFLFAGSGGDEQMLRNLAEQCGVSRNVSFLGNRADMPELLSACDVAVLPSTKEGFSNAVIESMACGLPVVASNVGGNSEVIDRGINGYLLDPPPTQPTGSPGGDSFAGPAFQGVNASQFTRFVKRLVTEDDHRAARGAAARIRALDFSLDIMVRRVEQMYMDLLGENGL